MSPHTRLTVNLIPRSTEALAKATELTGHSKTDTVNRALQVYAFFEQVSADGGELLVRRAGRDELEVLRVL